MASAARWKSAEFDCSGLVHIAYRRLGRFVLRDAHQQEAPAPHPAFDRTGRLNGVIEKIEPAHLQAERRRLIRL